MFVVLAYSHASMLNSLSRLLRCGKRRPRILIVARNPKRASRKNPKHRKSPKPRRHARRNQRRLRRKKANKKPAGVGMLLKKTKTKSKHLKVRLPVVVVLDDHINNFLRYAYTLCCSDSYMLISSTLLRFYPPVTSIIILIPCYADAPLSCCTTGAHLSWPFHSRHGILLLYVTLSRTNGILLDLLLVLTQQCRIFLSVPLTKANF